MGIGARRLLVVGAIAISACDSNSHSTGSGIGNIAAVGDLVSDPTREVVYVTDRDGGWVHAMSTRTGEPLRRAHFGSRLTQLAVDQNGDKLFVAAPDFGEVIQLDAETFTTERRLQVEEAPMDMVWRHPGTLVMATAQGLVEVNPASRGRRSLQADVGENSLLAINEDGGALFVMDREPIAFALAAENTPPSSSDSNRSSVLRVRRFGLPTTDDFPAHGSAAADLEASTSVVQLQGEGLGIHLSYDNSRVIASTNGQEGIYVLDALSLATDDTVSLGPDLNAVAVNTISTRMFTATQEEVVDSLNLASFDPGGGVLSGGAVQDQGLLVAADSLSLVVHTDDKRVETRRAFRTQLLGAPVARLGTRYEIEAVGTPGDRFIMLASTTPGFIFLKSPNQEELFLDLDLRNLLIVFAGTFDQTGRIRQGWNVDPFPILDGETIIAQFLVRDGITGKPKDVSNPLLIRFRW